jgi:hypothetical protein
MPHLKLDNFHCNCKVVTNVIPLQLKYMPTIWYWSTSFDFICKLHESCYKQLWCIWYVIMVQGLFNITKFQLGFNYAHKFEIYTIWYVIHGCILVNPKTYIYNYHAFVSSIF